MPGHTHAASPDYSHVRGMLSTRKAIGQPAWCPRKVLVCRVPSPRLPPGVHYYGVAHARRAGEIATQGLAEAGKMWNDGLMFTGKKAVPIS